MHQTICLLLLTACLSAQSTSNAARAAIRKAKNLPVSSLDSRLPKVSLKFFLKYEAAGAPIAWAISDCDDDPATRHSADSPVCVEADFSLKSGTTVAVVVSVGNLGRIQGHTALVRATVTNLGGLPRIVRRLGDLPMELQRWAPETPRDLPLPVEALQTGKDAQPVCRGWVFLLNSSSSE